jgi:membrane protein implicated in regulation of membrane protease activity
MGGGLTILVVVAVALWAEFSEPGNTAWNIALAAMLLALVAAALLGQRYFRAHAGEIGEARFDTRNEGDR